jgi:hypothetical protein
MAPTSKPPLARGGFLASVACLWSAAIEQFQGGRQYMAFAGSRNRNK